MTEHARGLTRKSIGGIIEDTDGIRILTVSRRTQNDGQTPSALFYEGSYDYWQKELAPPAALVGAWYRHEVTREDFEKYYRLSLSLPTQKELVTALCELGRQTKVTLLCVCEVKSPDDYCHTLTLLEVCTKESNSQTLGTY